jgi:hypothetical protein
MFGLLLIHFIPNAMSASKNVEGVPILFDGGKFFKIFGPPKSGLPVGHGVLGLAEVGPLSGL